MLEALNEVVLILLKRFGESGHESSARAGPPGDILSELVVLMVRWLGHSEYDLVVRACKTAQVLFLIVAKGSVTALQQEVQQHLDAGGYPSGVKRPSAPRS
ncbi:hypothetical protein WME99_34465 [Sorangium sp. So ce136]|uniref:hypothetical protein n=1 Tax=Sorangium sp. So ce136 TaxID=3133284 RepID=UPI003F066E6B